MKHGLIDYIAITKGHPCSLKVIDDYRNNFRELLSKHRILTISLEFTANVIETHKGGILNFYTDNIEIKAKEKAKSRSREQQNLLRAIERLIFFASNNREPFSEEINNIHEALLELYAPRKEAPIGDKPIIVRTGDPDLTTKGMAKIIWGAWMELSALDIPENVSDAIDNDMKNVWDEIKQWKHQHYYEIFREIESTMDFEEYKETHSNCEFTGKKGTIEDPLVRIHIISKGAHPEWYEKPWNYVMGLDSIHQRIHRKGWDNVLKDYPHLGRKYNDAWDKIRREEGFAERLEISSGESATL